MGYDTDLFAEEELNEELICSICTGVLEYPVTTECDHLFCSQCIQDWLRTRQTCPIDRRPLRQNKLRPAPRVIRNLISRLKVSCLYHSDGCQQQGLTLDQLSNHATQCPFNPDSPVTCKMFCAKTMTRSEMKTHDCIKDVSETLKNLHLQIQKRDIKIFYLKLIVFILIISLIIIIIIILFPSK